MKRLHISATTYCLRCVSLYARGHRTGSGFADSSSHALSSASRQMQPPPPGFFPAQWPQSGQLHYTQLPAWEVPPWHHPGGPRPQQPLRQPSGHVQANSAGRGLQETIQVHLPDVNEQSLHLSSRLASVSAANVPQTTSSSGFGAGDAREHVC